MLFRFRSKAVFLVAISFAIVLATGCGNKMDYSQGKDCKEAFGNGEYQLLRYTEQDQSRKLALFNCDVHEAILYDVQLYKSNEETVYVRGKCPVYEYRETEMCATIYTKDNSVEMRFNGIKPTAEMVEKMRQYLTKFLTNKQISVNQ